MPVRGLKEEASFSKISYSAVLQRIYNRRDVEKYANVVTVTTQVSGHVQSVGIPFLHNLTRNNHKYIYVRSRVITSTCA
jgi:hypothetical protein